MSRMNTHITYSETDSGEITDQPLAYIHPASKESVQTVLAADESSPDGRSQWVWVRLANGDLILGLYPQGGTYFECEKDACYP